MIPPVKKTPVKKRCQGNLCLIKPPLKKPPVKKIIVKKQTFKKICPPGKELNPKTGRCINIKTLKIKIKVKDSWFDYKKNKYLLYKEDLSKFPNQKVHEAIYNSIVKSKGNGKKILSVLLKYKKHGADDTASREAVDHHFKKLYKRSIVDEPKKIKLKIKCPVGKELNPKTGRCINKKTIMKVNLPKKANTPKKRKLKIKCPVGKELNPKTGRCINKKTTKTVKPTKTVTLNKKVKPTKTVKLNKKVKLVIKISKKLWDIHKDGVMLAHTFKDPKTGKIKSAPKGFPQAPVGWYMSEKFDGYRALWDGKDFRSRAGNIFVAPEWFKDWLPKDSVLDGELFMGRECFEKCGMFRRKIPNDEEWKKNNVQYRIFDIPSIKKPFEKRMAELKKKIKDLCSKKSGKCPLIMTPQILVKSEEHLYEKFNTLTKKGAEGVMIRSPNSPYEGKRSSHLLKVKQRFDDECIIVGYKMGTGKYKDMLGSFNCEMKKNRQIKFDISGMDDSIRKNYKTTHPIGTEVTFTYMGLSERGNPRHPNYLRKRN